MTNKSYNTTAFQITTSQEVSTTRTNDVSKENLKNVQRLKIEQNHLLKNIQQLTQENKIYKKCVEEFEEQKQWGQEIMRKYYQDETKKKISRKESNDNGQREETSGLKDSTDVRSKVDVASNIKSAEEGQCDSDNLKIYPTDVMKNVTNSNLSLESDHKDPSPMQQLWSEE